MNFRIQWDRLDSAFVLIWCALSLRLARRFAYFTEFQFPTHLKPAYFSFRMPIEQMQSNLFYAISLVCFCLLLVATRKRSRTIALVGLFLIQPLIGGGAAIVGKSLLVMQSGLLFFAKKASQKNVGAYLWLFLACMYGFNGLAKISWWQTDALALFLTDQLWGPGLRFDSSTVSQLLSRLVIVFEMTGFLLVFPWKNFRRMYFFAALLFHLFIAFHSPFLELSMGIIALWLLALGEPTAKPSLKLNWFLLMLFLVTVNLPISLPAPVTKALRSFSLDLRWRLFSPLPGSSQDSLSISFLNGKERGVDRWERFHMMSHWRHPHAKKLLCREGVHSIRRARHGKTSSETLICED